MDLSPRDTTRYYLEVDPTSRYPNLMVCRTLSSDDVVSITYDPATKLRTITYSDNFSVTYVDDDPVPNMNTLNN